MLSRVNRAEESLGTRLANALKLPVCGQNYVRMRGKFPTVMVPRGPLLTCKRCRVLEQLGLIEKDTHQINTVVLVDAGEKKSFMCLITIVIQSSCFCKMGNYNM